MFGLEGYVEGEGQQGGVDRPGTVYRHLLDGQTREYIMLTLIDSQTVFQSTVQKCPTITSGAVKHKQVHI